jgi:hypothetical protein
MGIVRYKILKERGQLGDIDTDGTIMVKKRILNIYGVLGEGGATHKQLNTAVRS